MANKNFEIKNGLTVAGTERITAAGAGSLTNLTLSGNLTVNGTTVTLDASTLQVADKNIVLNYHASNDTSSASGGAGITIQDAVNGTTDATILWDASDDEFDFSHGINIPNLKVSGGQGTDGQLLTSTGSGVAWEDAPASGPTFKAFGTSSIMVGDSTTGTINAADYNTGLGVDVFANLTSGDQNTAIGFEAGNGITTQGQNTLIGYQAGKLVGSQRNTFIGFGAGRDVDEGQRAIAIGYYAMMSSTGSTTGDIAIGYQAMQYRASNSGDSIAIGSNAHRGDINQGYQNANRNVAIGNNALSVVETGAIQNTVVGWWAGYNVTTGPNNTLIGSEAGQAVSTGQLNTLLGYRAGELITTGNYNIVLGSYDGNEGGLDIRTASNRVVISDGTGNIRMYIDNSGNVGIGETSPSAKLHVKKTAASTQHYDLYATAIIEDTEGRLQIIATDGGSNASALLLSNEEKHWGVVNHGPSQNNTFGIGYYASSSTGGDFADSLSSPFTITTSGNVGIGDTSPDNKLSIRAASTIGTKNGHIMLTGDSATNGQGPQIVFSESGNSSDFAGASVGYARTGSNGIGDLIFGTRATSGDANTVPTERMRIHSNGNVGIGTDSPDGLLHISSGNSGNAIVIIQADEDNNNESDNPQLWFKQDGDITEGAIRLSDNRLQIINNVNSVGGISFITGNQLPTGTTDPATGATEKVRIETGGDVKIGSFDTGNAYKLEVYDGDYTQLMLRAPTYPILKFKADNQNSGNNGSIGVGGANSLVLQPNNATNGINISNSGHVTMSNQPKFHAFGGSSTAQNSDVIYASTYVNDGGHYNTSNGRFTAPVAGVYLFFWSAIGNTTNDVYRWYLRVNGSAAISGTGNDVHLRQDTGATGSEYASNGSRVQMLDLAVNDYVTINFQSDSNSSHYVGSDYINFGGYLIG